VELLHWGKVLEPSSLLSDYSLLPSSELSVKIHPRLPACVIKAKATEPLRRVRLSSRKLQESITIDCISPETTGAELKRLVQAHFAKQPTYFAKAKAEGDERAGTMDLSMCDQVIFLGMGAKKGIIRGRRVRDGEEGSVLEESVMQLQLDADPKQLLIFFDGTPLTDEAPLSKYGLIHNERLTLDFRWPWVEDDKPAEEGKGKGDKGGGKGKKKK